MANTLTNLQVTIELDLIHLNEKELKIIENIVSKAIRSQKPLSKEDFEKITNLNLRKVFPSTYESA